MEPLSAGERGGQGYVPIRNEDKPLPEGEEGGWKRKRSKPPRPRGLVGLHHSCSAVQCNRSRELRMKLAPRAPNGTSTARLVVGWLADCNCEGNDIGAAFEAYATRACDIASPP